MWSLNMRYKPQHFWIFGVSKLILKLNIVTSAIFLHFNVMIFGLLFYVWFLMFLKVMLIIHKDMMEK